MAIIKCSECGAMISDKASRCPKCGFSFVAVPEVDTMAEPADSNLMCVVDILKKYKETPDTEEAVPCMSMYICDIPWRIDIFVSDQDDTFFFQPTNDVIEITNIEQYVTSGLKLKAAAQVLLKVIDDSQVTTDDVWFDWGDLRFTIEDGQVLEDYIEDDEYNQYENTGYNEYVDTSVDDDSDDGTGKVVGFIIAVIIAIFYFIIEVSSY